jgi:hypothetical protein
MSEENEQPPAEKTSAKPSARVVDYGPHVLKRLDNVEKFMAALVEGKKSEPLTFSKAEPEHPSKPKNILDKIDEFFGLA